MFAASTASRLVHPGCVLRPMTFAAALAFALGVSASDAVAQRIPEVLTDEWSIELVASSPNLVTPISCRFDSKGRLFVVESHTHFPPDQYSGPKSDRIYIFDDSTGDGRLDRQRLFYEGGRATMSLEVLPDGAILVATRDAITRIRDTDGDDVADESVVLVRHETPASYPHNGLCGLVIAPNGDLFFGQGENLGEPYQIVGRDGSRQDGGGEGGNVFRCRPDGTGLTRFATGFWNPFGMHFDSSGRLWAVCNDPDAMPPCRLLHVVEGADFGFQFRFDRAGTHPLQAWNGEQPGTLPMAAGTGEAPCAVVEHGHFLWVTSWGDNRIERYGLHPQGASFEARMEVVVQGGADFRPVDMAISKDGSIYVTDWVDRSYPVHGRGGLWRLVPKSGAAWQGAVAALSDAEKLAQSLIADDSIPLIDRTSYLDDTDRFIAHAAAIGLARTGQLRSATLEQMDSAGKRIGWITAHRWQNLTHPESLDETLREKIISDSLTHASPEVVRAAIRWAAECGDQRFLDPIRAALARPDLPDNLFASAVAGIAYLETGGAARGKRDPAQEKLLIRFAADDERSTRLRAKAVRMLPAEADLPSIETLRQWIERTPEDRFVTEIVRLLVARGNPEATSLLGEITAMEGLGVEVRGDAIAGLARNASSFAAVLNRYGLPKQNETLRREARRVLRREADEPGLLRPTTDDIPGWDRLIGDGGDARAGWRVFVRTTCVNCHAYAGRGAAVGPDLTAIGGQMTRQKLIESILQPSKEVGPLFVAWQVLTEDGRALTGLKLNDGSGSHAKFIGADGERFEVPLVEIVSQRPSKESIMPARLEETMSIAEMRDLIAFLLSRESGQ
jgi:putative membrane-bound dehydrogenase-like protein